MFGSTVESVLRSFTNEINEQVPKILTDGSMHSLIKQKHLTSREDLISFLDSDTIEESIITPIYPMADLTLAEITSLSNDRLGTNNYKILLHADSFEYAEINMLFQYHKIALSNSSTIRLEIFCGDNHKDIVNWNQNYTNWKQMQSWELREWFSLFYPQWINEWIESPTHVDTNWIIINTREILCDTEQTLEKIIKFSGLTRNKKNLTEFANNWRRSQQYVLDEYQLINRVVSCTITQVDFSWNRLNIIAEAMIQNKLREVGFEILCDGLNDFPTNSIELHKLLIGKNNNA